MKITKLKAVICNAEMRNWVFVKLETDVAGLYGWGECSLEWKTRSVAGALEDFAPMIVGEDPTRIEHLVSKDVSAIVLAHRRNWAVGDFGH